MNFYNIILILYNFYILLTYIYIICFYLVISGFSGGQPGIFFNLVQEIWPGAELQGDSLFLQVFTL